MNLNELREEFKSSSGFLFWENSEIDKALNEGIRFLDSRIFTSKKDQRFFTSLSSGQQFLFLPFKCRLVKELWINDVDGRRKIEKKDREDILLPTSSGGIPSSYCLMSSEPAEKTMDKMDLLALNADIVFQNGTGRGIFFNIPADRNLQIEIFGRFSSIPLSSSNTENWLSVNYPELIIKTALYVLDIPRRNTSGGKELLEVILYEIQEINNEGIEDEIEDTEMVLGG